MEESIMNTFKNTLVLALLVAFFFCGINLEARNQTLTGRARPYFRGARTELQGHRYELALNRFLSVLEHQPDHVESRWRAANIYFMFAGESGDMAEAKRLYREGYNHFRICIETIENMPDWRRFTNFPEWKEDSELKIQSTFVRIYRMGYELYEEEDFEGAIAVLYELKDIFPTHPETFILLSTIEKQRDDLGKAIAYLKQILEFDPSNVVVITSIVSDYMNMHLWEDAKVYLQKLVEVQPDNIFGHFNLAVVNLETENFEAALSSWEDALRIEPNDANIIRNTINTTFTLNRYDQAVVLLKRLITVLDTNIDSLRERAEQTTDEELILAIQEAISETSNEKTVEVAQLTNLLVRNEKWEDVITYGRLWYKLDPTATNAVMFIVHAANRLGNQEIVNQYSRILQGMN